MRSLVTHVSLWEGEEKFEREGGNIGQVQAASWKDEGSAVRLPGQSGRSLGGAGGSRPARGVPGA